jgi:hypothetical protein
MKGINIFLIYSIFGCLVYIGNGISILKDPIDETMRILYIMSLSFFIISLIILRFNPITERNVPYSGYIIFWLFLAFSWLCDYVISTTLINDIDINNTDFLPAYNTVVPLAAKSVMIIILLITDGMELRKIINTCKGRLINK